MPAKHSIKIYIENGYYHVYNRGVDKRDIFLDIQDYATFLYFLKYYLGKPNPSDIKQLFRSLENKVQLVAYCLMPNHFHFLLKQKTTSAMTELIRAVSTNYVMYFNQKYKRVGPLFQGKYKAVLIQEEPYLLHLTRYIHRNPINLIKAESRKGPSSLQRYQYSSYECYLDTKHTSWIHPEEILVYFHNPTKITHRDFFSYKNFVEDQNENSEEFLEELTLELQD